MYFFGRNFPGGLNTAKRFIMMKPYIAAVFRAGRKEHRMNWNEKLKEIANTKDNSAEFEAEDISKNRIMGILWLAGLLLSLFGILAANNGEAKELPVIGSIRLIK